MFSIENHVTDIFTVDYIKSYRDSDRFIACCQVCDKYKNCWACPPYDFDTDKYISKYKKVYIIGTKIIPAKEVTVGCTDGEACKRVGTELIKEARKVLDNVLLKIEGDFSDSRALFAGTCHVCDVNDCTRIVGKSCRYPDKIRYSLESFGFDIGKTTQELLKIELKWSQNGSFPEYLTLVSALFSNDEITDLSYRLDEAFSMVKHFDSGHPF